MRYTNQYTSGRRVGMALAFLLLAGLLAACGDSTQPTAQPSASALASTPVATTPTVAPTTQVTATTQAATVTTQAAASSQATSTTQPAATPQAATTRAATTQAATATTQAATTTQAAPAPTATANRSAIGNNYPAGPAPTAAPPAGGLVDATLQVPQSLRRGVFEDTHTMKLPRGFTISVYSQLQNVPRFGVFSPDGRLFISERSGGRVVVLKDNGETGERQVWAEGMNGPHGLAFQQVQGQTFLYVAENDKVTRFAYDNGQAKASRKEVIVSNIPAGGGHTTRSIAFGPDGKMYIAAGSSCNVCEESDKRRAAVTQYNADGTGERIFAEGLRNEVGIMFHPETGEMWGVENSRDNLGRGTEENNNIPPEEINIITDGGHYGWPYCYSNQVYDQNYGRRNAEFCKQTIPPALPMQAHSAPLGLDFYLPKTMQFPADYRGDVFVGFHGSWNRSPATGYKVVRVRVKDGRPVSYEDFAMGWQTGPNSNWGRPVAPIVAPDGSLFVTDGTTNVVYKITYKA